VLPTSPGVISLTPSQEAKRRRKPEIERQRELKHKEETPQLKERLEVCHESTCYNKTTLTASQRETGQKELELQEGERPPEVANRVKETPKEGASKPVRRPSRGGTPVANDGYTTRNSSRQHFLSPDLELILISSGIRP